MNDIALNKIQSIQRCVARAREEYARAGDKFGKDFTRQDAATLNILRACEQAIDLANHLIRQEKMGVPTNSAESFLLLARNGVIPDELAKKLGKMVQFRNIVTHAYQTAEIDIIVEVINTQSNDLIIFADQIKKFTG